MLMLKTRDFAQHYQEQRMLNNTDYGIHICSIYIHLSQAFATELNFLILLKNCNSFGIRGIPQQLAIFQIVSSHYASFLWGTSTTRVTLDPLLFIMYVNDFLNCSDLKLCFL